MSSQLIAHIRQFVALTTEDAELIEQHTTTLSLAKKEYLLKDGQVCNGQYFVAEGCLRMFFINDKGVEQITQFALEGWWMTDNMSLLRRQPSQFCIQTVEPTTVVKLSADAQQTLYDQVPAMERYMRIVQQYAYAAAQMRIKFLHDLSKEEHYKHFMQHYPEFAQRIPQYMLASFLGFTPEYLSELRKKNS